MRRRRLPRRARRRGSERTCSGGAVTSAGTTRTRGDGCGRGASLNRSRASLARSGSTSTSSGLTTKSGSGRFTESIGSLSSIDIDFLARGRMVEIASDKRGVPSALAVERPSRARKASTFPRRSRAVSVRTRGAPGDRKCRDAPAPPEHLVCDRRLRGGAALPLRRAPDIRVPERRGAAGPPDAAPLGIAAVPPSANPDPAAQLAFYRLQMWGEIPHPGDLGLERDVADDVSDRLRSRG